MSHVIPPILRTFGCGGRSFSSSLPGIGGSDAAIAAEDAIGYEEPLMGDGGSDFSDAWEPRDAGFKLELFCALDVD